MPTIAGFRRSRDRMSIAVLGAALLPAFSSACEQTGKLTLPHGFCAEIFADAIGGARHMAVARNGVLYVNTMAGSDSSGGQSKSAGLIVALQGLRTGGNAQRIARFGSSPAQGGRGGTGIALYDGYLYVEANDKIVRYRLPAQGLVPTERPETVIYGLPMNGDHPMHPFAIDAGGALYLDSGSASNACQKENRAFESPGIAPCAELNTRGGIWRYDAKRLEQKFSSAERYATGIRNAVGIAVDSSGRGVYATQHGRDQLAQNWPALYTARQGATLPAEELLRIEKNGDYGWPYCYFDRDRGKLVRAPEYGGDGGKSIGDCASKVAPVAAFPAHWGPNALLIYDGAQFPQRYRGGAFIAFHGSWNRSPFAQSGYNVVFQPLTGAASRCEIFADGFAGKSVSPGEADHRPSGLAVGLDGALYVSDDQRGRIYRITYDVKASDRGTRNDSAGQSCSDPMAPAKDAATR